MSVILTYLKLEYFKFRGLKKIFLLPFLFNALYFYGFFSSFEETYPVWKYEIKNLDKYTYWTFKVIDISSISLSLLIFIAAFQFVTIDKNNWYLFRFLPVKISKIHFSKWLLGGILILISQSVIYLFIYVEFILSYQNLFLHGNCYLLLSGNTYIEAIIFWTFAYSSCYLLNKNIALWIIVMTLLLFLRHFFSIFPGSFLYFSLRYGEIPNYFPQFFGFILLSSILTLYVLKRQ